MERMEARIRDARTSRRDLIKKAMVLGPASYVAPMVLGSATPALAAVISNPSCTAQTCNGGFTTGCNNNQACYCFTTSSSTGYCAVDFQCNGLTACDVQNPCGQGFVCLVNTCCGAGVCAPTSNACPAGGGTPPSPSPGNGSTAAGLN
mgnify:CR=1 FL=1